MSYSYITNNTLLNGSSGTSWSDVISIAPTNASSVLTVSGDATFSGDVVVKGKSLADTLDRIEERLAILHPNESLEAKWEELRNLRKAYMELEAEIIEKENIWNILQK